MAVHMHRKPWYEAERMWMPGLYGSNLFSAERRVSKVTHTSTVTTVQERHTYSNSLSSLSRRNSGINILFNLPFPKCPPLTLHVIILHSVYHARTFSHIFTCFLHFLTLAACLPLFSHPNISPWRQIPSSVFALITPALRIILA